MKMKKRICSALWLFLLSVFVSSYALSITASAADFGLRVIKPENQRSTATGDFFDLIMKAGSEQTIEVELKNTSDQMGSYKVDIALATTANSGVPIYTTRENYKADTTQRFTIEEIVTAEKEVKANPGEIIKVPIHVTMPNVEFSGIIAAGINISKTATEDGKEQEEAVGVKHEYQYTIALLLRQNETVVKPDLVLNDVKAGQFNFRNIIAANLQNVEPMYASQMMINASIRRVDETKLLYERQADMLQMAPNSNFDFAIPLNGQAFVAGDYILRMEVIADNGQWFFEREFTITTEEAKAFNATDLTISRLPIWVLIIAGLCLALIITLVFIKLFRGKTKKTQDKLIDDLMMEIKGANSLSL